MAPVRQRAGRMLWSEVNEQTIRDLLDRYAGAPLSAWAPADRETMLALWARVKTEPPQFAPARGR